jgi:ribonucleoside-diphosphate reductase alpha chain
MSWTPPQTLIPFEHDWDRPGVEWNSIVDGIKEHGIRNAAQTTVAPTGTIATVAGCEGYGCEPVFALAYIRHVNDHGKDLQLTYASPLFEKALRQAGVPEDQLQSIIQRVMRDGTCQNTPEVPASLRSTFVVSADISAEEHVRMQAALQAFVDNSLSKTINFPAEAVEEDVATAYRLAWELGCKGITVYVTGSREKVVLETKATAEKKQPAAAPAAVPTPAPVPAPVPAAQLPAAQAPMAPPVQPDRVGIPALYPETKKPRPRYLRGFTYSIETPLGKAFITINENGSNQPFEVFVNTAKAGSDTAAVSEAIGRLISYNLRLASPIRPRQRLEEVLRQLAGIGGGRSLGFGPNRVRSLPDGVAHALDEYLQSVADLEEQSAAPAAIHLAKEDQPIPAGDIPLFRFGDLCPECGQAAMVNEEGCHKCYACGFSEC